MRHDWTTSQLLHRNRQFDPFGARIHPEEDQEACGDSNARRGPRQEHCSMGE